MQEFIVHIVVGICAIWAIVMIYRRINGQRKGKCDGCPLHSSCPSCTESTGCAGCTGYRKSGRTKFRNDSETKRYPTN